MFAGIAGRYDIANRVLSLGIERGWRRRLIQKVSDLNPRNVVDLATGSGDVALEMRQALAPSTEIRGMDFCEPMFVKARDKASELVGDGPVGAELEALKLQASRQGTPRRFASWGVDGAGTFPVPRRASKTCHTTLRRV